jgi:hypothetical protein
LCSPSVVSPTPSYSSVSSPKPKEYVLHISSEPDADEKRTLEEMDQYFRDNYWFVPLAKTDRIGSKDRERDLAMGESTTLLGVVLG